MRTARQLSVSLINKPGRLADMLGALAKGKVNLIALAVMDSRDRGMVRFVPEDCQAATEVLEKLNIRFDSADVLLVDVPNQNGAFRNICERLAADHLNIDYAYCAVSTERGSKGNTLAVIKVNDLAKAQRVLKANEAPKRQLPRRRPLSAR
jgi:hypothetical protein